MAEDNKFEWDQRIVDEMWCKGISEIDLTDMTVSVDFAASYDAPMWAVPTNNEVKFYNGEGDVALCLNFSTGEVKLSDYMRADEAAQLFWDRVMELNPYPTQEVAVYSPESRTEQLGFFMTSKGEKMAWWETPGDGMDIGDAPVRKLDEPTPHPVEQFEFFTVSLLVDENESNYNRAMKVVK